MIQVHSSKFREKFANYLEKVSDESIEILVYKRPVAYLVSPEDYIILQKLKGME